MFFRKLTLPEKFKKYVTSDKSLGSVIVMKKLIKILCLSFILLTGTSSFAADADTTAPTAPTNLRGFVYAPDFIYINWTPATDNVGVYVYRVYRNAELVATTYDKYFLDMEYDRDVPNAYGITAVDKAGNESELSNIIRDPREQLE